MAEWWGDNETPLDDVFYGAEASGGTSSFSWWDVVRNAASGASPLLWPTTGLPEGLSAPVQNKLAELQAQAAAFSVELGAFAELQTEVENTPVAPEYFAIAMRAQNARTMLASTADAAQSVWGITKSAFGLSGARNMVLAGASQLGVVPAVLGYAAIAGVVAYLASVIADMRKFSMNWQLIREGKKPMPTGGPLESVTGAVKFAALAAVVVLIVPEILKGRK